MAPIANHFDLADLALERWQKLGGDETNALPSGRFATISEWRRRI
jgi:hypothetical protein